MNRSPILMPLLVFVAINVGLDVIAAIAFYVADSFQSKAAARGIFVGLLWGQFGWCCGIRLRWQSQWAYAYIGMLAIPLVALSVLLPDLSKQSDREITALVMLAAGFTMLYCLGPQSLSRWLKSQPMDTRFTLPQMFVGTVLFAFVCVIVMHFQAAIAMAMGVFVLAMPSMVASNMLAKTSEMLTYSWLMVAGVVICMLFLAGEPTTTPLIVMFLAQIMVLWLGGLLLISIGEGSARREVVGLPEE